MANSGVGNRFASVNLNKSYGHNQSNSSSHYGSGTRGRSGGGVGGGMVVLSRPRSSHKPGSKLSVPPPLNLPSLRKEHERFDSLGSGTGSLGAGAAGNGVRPSSSCVGWSKPSAVTVLEGGERPLSSDGAAPPVDGSGVSSVTTTYLPPSVRSNTDVSAPVPMGKTALLRGEDFPSLRATLTPVNSSVLKIKDPAHQKQRWVSDDTAGGQSEAAHLSSHFNMRPRLQSSQHSVGHGITGNDSDHLNSANSRLLDQGRKHDDFFPAPLPLVRMSPRSDWADDERDTSHGLMERSRDHGYSRTEASWDRDFDWPRSNFLPHKPARNNFDRRVQRDNDVRKGLSNEVSNADHLSRDVKAPSKEDHEGQLWRIPVSKDAFTSEEDLNDRNSVGARATAIGNKYLPPVSEANAQVENNTRLTVSREFATGRRDSGYVQVGRQQWNSQTDSTNSRGHERDRYGSELNRFKVESAPNSVGLKPSFKSGNKGPSGSDHLSTFGRDRRSFIRGETPYTEDPFLNDWGSTGFDGHDPFPGGIRGLVRRKKDANKQLDFHDPARESFEAELERVQKIQEQERQQIIEEQERVAEIARREEEERQKLAREQEECQRRLEEEAREANWRAEQEKLETLRRAEELRIAREEEKQMILMEEKRRKQAAKQKLLELEEKIARRQVEGANEDNSVAIQGDILPGGVKERDFSRADEFTGWEDGERMVERITNTASSDSCGRRFDMGYRATHEGSFPYTDRGKSLNSWRRDVFENGNSSSFFSSDYESGHRSPRRDASVGGRSFLRKDFYGGAGYMPTRGYYQGGIAESHMDDFPYARGHRWNISGNGDPYCRNTEFEAQFHENIAGKFDVGWGQGQGRGNYPFPERFCQNTELDEIYNYGRSRYSARQPRVLPPPSLSLVHPPPFRNESENTSSAAYDDENVQFRHTLRSETTEVSYQSPHEEHPDVLDVGERSAENGDQELNRSTTPGFDSQSSLSVSSPPSSPTHLSHDDLDESRDSQTVSVTVEARDISHLENEILLPANTGKGGVITTASSISVVDEEEWTVENNELLEQEEYEEDVGYHEEDEVLDVHDGNTALNMEFQDMHLEEKDSHISDNLVLGFDQGVEVAMPNDEYESSAKIDGSLFAGPQEIVGDTEPQESFEDSRDGQGLLVPHDSQHVCADCSFLTVQETEKAVQDFVSDPGNTSHSSTSMDPMNVGDSPSGTILVAQQSVPTPVGVNSQPSSQAVMPSGAGDQGRAELPVKLQFGLFSGPSLIPSPVPSIQIGSIQMPLQLHPQIGPSFTHMQSPQPPLFQFGQLSYPSPVSQGILPLGPPSMSFVQPNPSPSFPPIQKPGDAVSVQPVQDPSTTQKTVKYDTRPLIANNHEQQPQNELNVNQYADKEANVMTGQSAGSNVLLHQNQADASRAPVDLVRPESGQQVETVGHSFNAIRKSQPLLNRSYENQMQGGSTLSRSASSVLGSNVPALQGQLLGSKGRRSFTERNYGAKLSSPAHEGSRTNANGFQRRPRRVTQRFEFRVRRASDGKQSSPMLLSDDSGLNAKSNSDGKGYGKQPKVVSKNDHLFDEPKQAVGSESSSSLQCVRKETGSWIKGDIPSGKEVSTNGIDTAWQAEGSLKRNISPEDDVDAPLQSGIVRVFKQPGIEAPSDDDDFIEVRSKRQMLNDRREQREKEIKAKSSNLRKSQHKPRSTSQCTTSVRSTTRTSISSNSPAAKSICAPVLSNQGLVNNEVLSFDNVVSQTLAAVGNAPVNTDSHTDAKSQKINLPQTSSYSTTGITVESDLSFDTQSKVLVNVHSSASSRDNSQINQPVMALTQTQLEEAMKPAHFDKQMVPVGDQASSVSEPGMPSSSVFGNDNSFSSATSPISSLLAGEKIQFGAVTSPTILPPSRDDVSQGIRPTASSRLDIQNSRNVPASDNNCVLLFEDKRCSESHPLDDCEAEAEAAASAVAVAAISNNDEVVRTGIDVRSASISDPKNFVGADVDGTTSGVVGMSCEQQLVGQSNAEEGLSVTLPADLSVETPPMSLWPPLPSPHSSSNSMLSPFPGGPSSHFPFYDMNPMMGGPVFAFGPHEESAGVQSQPQKSSVPNSAPLGAWQHCHTGVDSFYRPPAGFTGPFISAPGNISGVQGPPHMVVYNHFAPVGQFGQLGLSYMGTAYIPSGKQPDWKHTAAASSAMSGGEGEMNNLNVVPVQHNVPSVPAHVRHLAPGSPLLSMASPLAMFEVSPFQNSPDPSGHPCWSHVQASVPPSIPQSMPMQQQTGGTGSPQFNPGSTNHHSLVVPNGLAMPQTSSLVDGRSFAVGTNAAVTPFPDELGLVDPPASTGLEASVLDKSRPGGTFADSVTADPVTEVSGNKKNPQAAVSASHKTQSAPQRNPPGQSQYNHYQRGVTQKNVSGIEWLNRKIGFHGRNHASGGERGYPPTKVKQIYVAKQSAGGTSV